MRVCSYVFRICLIVFFDENEMSAGSDTLHVCVRRVRCRETAGSLETQTHVKEGKGLREQERVKEGRPWRRVVARLRARSHAATRISGQRATTGARAACAHPLPP